jgi:predicted DNA-binding protein (MmcQ/YjbR family)
MDLEMLRNYCLRKTGTQEAFPFDNETLVFKVGSKMFALTNINKKPLQINLKCDPYTAEELRSEYPSIKPGYHMNKRHWNTVIVDGTLDDGRICWMVDMSYKLVLSGLKKGERESILNDSQEES